MNIGRLHCPLEKQIAKRLSQVQRKKIPLIELAGFLI